MGVLRDKTTGRWSPSPRPWRSFEAVEFATLEWVDWFSNRRVLEPISTSAGRGRRALLRHAGATSHGGVTQTKQPPENPGRFTSASGQSVSEKAVDPRRARSVLLRLKETQTPLGNWLSSLLGHACHGS